MLNRIDLSSDTTTLSSDTSNSNSSDYHDHGPDPNITKIPNVEDIDPIENRICLLKLTPRKITNPDNNKISKGLVFDEIDDEALLIRDHNDESIAVRHDQINIMILKEVQRLSKTTESIKYILEDIKALEDTLSNFKTTTDFTITKLSEEITLIKEQIFSLKISDDILLNKIEELEKIVKFK